MKKYQKYFGILLILSILTVGMAMAIPDKVVVTPGKINKIGTVDVRNLPEGPGTVNSNRVIPVHYINPEALAREKVLADTPGFIPPGQNEKTIISPPLAGSVTLNKTLGGISGDQSYCSCSPPDTNLGVGQDHVFEMVNMAGIIYYKNGTLAKNTFPLSGFFGTAYSDPQIIYDNGSHRWFASIIGGYGVIRVAVSNSEDPTGTWTTYDVLTSSLSTLPDQPFIGISDDKFVVSANDFAGGSSFIGVQYWVINKNDLVNGVASPNSSTFGPDSSYFSVHPAMHYGTSSGKFYMVTVGAGTTSKATVFTIDGTPGISTVSSTPQSFTIKTTSVPPNAAQPTSAKLETNDNRVLSAVWENNTLWFSANDACKPNGDRQTRSCVRLVQITTSGTLSKVQDFDYASSGQYFFYPAVSLYQGQLAVVYGLSSSSIYPSLLVTGRSSADSLNTLRTPATIKKGAASDITTRYGDYFGAATDPTPSTNSAFWVAGEYRQSSGWVSWSTAIAQVGPFS